MTATATTGSTRRHRPRVNRVMLALLRSPLHRVVSGGLCELRYRGPRSGRLVSLPVGYAGYGDRLVVLVGHAAEKRWWRAFLRPYPLEVRRGPDVRTGVGQIVHPHHPSSTAAREAYQRRHRVRIGPTDRLLLIDEQPGSAGTHEVGPRG